MVRFSSRTLTTTVSPAVSSPSVSKTTFVDGLTSSVSDLSFSDSKKLSERKVGDFSGYDAGRLIAALGALEGVQGSSWYEAPGADVDVAMARLCLLRRAKAGAEGSMNAGDGAVRLALNGIDSDTLVWLLSRAVSYMDEAGFPDFVPGARLEDD